MITTIFAQRQCDVTFICDTLTGREQPGVSGQAGSARKSLQFVLALVVVVLVAVVGEHTNSGQPTHNRCLTYSLKYLLNIQLSQCPLLRHRHRLEHHPHSPSNLTTSSLSIIPLCHPGHQNPMLLLFYLRNRTNSLVEGFLSSNLPWRNLPTSRTT